MKQRMFFLLLPMFIAYQSEAGTKNYTGADNPVLTVGVNKKLNARVYFSTQIPVGGIAQEDKVFYISSQGSFLYVIVDNYPTPIRFNRLRVLIYKTIDGQSVRTDEKFYYIDGTFTYTYIKYTFYSTGSYIFDVFSDDNTFIGTGKVEIKNSNTSNSSSSENNTVSGPRVYFSTQVPIAGVATDVKSFQLQSGGGYVYVIVDNYPNNFNVPSLRVNIYRYENGRYKKIDRRVYDIDGDLYYTYFTHTFRQSGDYKFEVFDSRDRFINTGYVSVAW